MVDKTLSKYFWKPRRLWSKFKVDFGFQKDTPYININTRKLNNISKSQINSLVVTKNKEQKFTLQIKQTQILFDV